MDSLWPVVLAVLVVVAGLLGYGIVRRRRRAISGPSAAPALPSPLATLERALEKTRERLGARLDAIENIAHKPRLETSLDDLVRRCFLLEVET